MWDEHEECKAVVKQAWGKDVGDKTGWDVIIHKSRNCSHELRRWHSRTFKNAAEEIPKLKEKLH
ncbi:hypothetical protein SESBI_44267 [Sesbania bispinosa]|nr:hypothetical protein SESBI_44267 [Sesbania bispinosa]